MTTDQRTFWAFSYCRDQAYAQGCGSGNQAEQAGVVHSKANFKQRLKTTRG